MKNHTLLLETSLLEIWNERDAEKRLGAMRQIYADDIEFYESEETPVFIGHQRINDLIGKLQADWAPEFEFTETEETRANGNLQIASWTLGIPGQTPVAKGKDVALVENGKIAKLYLFLG